MLDKMLPVRHLCLAKGAGGIFAPTKVGPHGGINSIRKDYVEERLVAVVLQAVAPGVCGHIIPALGHTLISGAPGGEPGPQGVLDMLGNRLLEAVLVLKIVGPTSHFLAEWSDGLDPITPKRVHHEVYGPFPGDGGLAVFPIVVWHLEGWAVFYPVPD